MRFISIPRILASECMENITAENVNQSYKIVEREEEREEQAQNHTTYVEFLVKI